MSASLPDATWRPPAGGVRGASEAVRFVDVVVGRLLQFAGAGVLSSVGSAWSLRMVLNCGWVRAASWVGSRAWAMSSCLVPSPGSGRSASVGWRSARE